MKEWFHGATVDGDDMKLHEEWKQAWRWLAVQLGAIVAVAPEIYEQFGGMKEYVSDAAFHHVMAGLGILVILNTVKRKAPR